MSYDPRKDVWLNPDIEYLFDFEIIEYDIKDAGFSIIREYKLLPKNKIDMLTDMGKGKQRHVTIGKMMGDDKEFSRALTTKFGEVRKIFIDKNQLSDNKIISVKKDAIFTIGRCQENRFGDIVFAEKNKYSSYIRFHDSQDIELLYASDQIDIKGMNDSAVNRHRLYMLDFIKKAIEMIENRDEKVKRFLVDFIMDYKSRRLDDEYYLKFNRQSNEMDLLYNFRNIVIPLVQMTMRELP